MKTKNSPATDGYNVIPPNRFPYITLAAAADDLEIRKQRMSRLLRILQVPVHQVGTLVLLDQKAINRIRRALRNNEVRRGRKPNAE